MKILSIGNSFSQDAQKWLNKLAKLNGIDLETANLFIGGCSLEKHWNNLKDNRADYEFWINGNEPERTISIEEALKLTNKRVVEELGGLPSQKLHCFENPSKMEQPQSSR